MTVAVQFSADPYTDADAGSDVLSLKDLHLCRIDGDVQSLSTCSSCAVCF